MAIPTGSISQYNQPNMFQQIGGWLGNVYNGIKNWATGAGNSVTQNSPSSYGSTQTAQPTASLPFTPTASAQTGPLQSSPYATNNNGLGSAGPLTATQSANNAAYIKSIGAPSQWMNAAGINPSDIASTTNNLSPVNYSINPGSTIDSSSFSPATTQTAIDAQTSAANGMMSGTSNGVPTTSFLQSIMPQYQQYASDYAGSNAAANSERLAQLNQVESTYTQGGITTAGRDAAINDINQRYGTVVSQNEVGAQAANANMDAVSRFYSTFMQPMQVAPGSSLVTPLGQQVYQGTGASPDAIAQYAQTLYSRDASLGTPQMNPDGSINWNYYSQQAKGLISAVTGQGGNSSGSSSSSGTPSSTGVQSGTVGAIDPTTGQQTSVQYQGQPNGQPQGFGQNGYGNVSAVPAALRSYVQQVSITNADGSVSSLPFIDAERVPTAMQPQAQVAAAQAGIPYMDQTGSSAIYSAQQIVDVVNSAEALAIRNLKPGVGGKVQDAATAWANQWLQFNPDLSNFNQLRDAAARATTALAGGVGSGFRMNMSVIENAIQNLPEASDNLETAMTKAEALRGQIMNAIAPLFPQLGQKPILSNNYSASNPTGSDSNPFSDSNFYGQ